MNGVGGRATINGMQTTPRRLIVGERLGECTWLAYLQQPEASSGRLAAAVSSYAEALDQAREYDCSLLLTRSAYEQMLAAGVGPDSETRGLTLLD
jgi:hypothetical protein